ncbi:hypothetical protein OC834_003930 [Tilletia horrida]|nr:hypothetical protein OC834_003930 [Tilletia horrida]
MVTLALWDTNEDPDHDSYSSDSDQGDYDDFDVTLTAETAISTLECEAARPEFLREWSFQQASARAKRISGSVSDWDSADDFFGILAEKTLPPLPPPPSALGMPPVYTEYDPSSGQWQVFSAGKKQYWIRDENVCKGSCKFLARQLPSLRVHLPKKAPCDSECSEVSSPQRSDSPSLTDSLCTLPSAFSSPGGFQDMLLPIAPLRRFSMPPHLKMWQPALPSAEPRPKRRWMDKWAALPPQPARIGDLDFTYSTVAGQGPLFVV